jgi:hypothetical protein
VIVTLVAVAGFALNQGALAQQQPRSQVYGAAPEAAVPGQPQAPLTKFDLDFPGGTPADLVSAIEKASGKPLNIVIPIGSAETPLPALKMRNVHVPELFNALQMASQTTASSQSRSYGGQVSRGFRALTYTFQTADRPPRDDSVWFFSSQSTEEAKACRFWQLAPYLDDYTIDDITTAVQTGYKMLGEEPPEINFHKDTKLLIAVGEEPRLFLIDAALQQLTPKAASQAAPGGKRTGTTGEPVKAAGPKNP